MLIKPIEGLSDNDCHRWCMATPAIHDKMLLYFGPEVLV